MSRTDHDLLGAVDVPDGVLWGAHTARAAANFAISGRPVNAALLRAGAEVKLACCRANAELGFLAPALAEGIAAACREIVAGGHADQFPADALQGGAGTSTNMGWNEVIAARATRLCGQTVDPLEHVNLHQSTNDVYPTALRVAAIREIRLLEEAIVRLLESCQNGEREFAAVVKLGRTQLRDAVPVTLGRAFGAWASALARDRWRVEKCVERLREVNLGGTAVGTGLAAPRDYIFLVAEKLREVTGLNLARADNLMDATQNADAFAEVSGILKAHAVTLAKLGRDLRLLSSGPVGGLGEIELPAMQAGSSIMPGKINPVMAEMAMQAAFRVMAHDVEIGWVAASGELELNAFLPLLADALLDSLQLLARTDGLLAARCVTGITANAGRCREWAERSREIAAALIPAIGHARAVELAQRMQQTGQGVREAAQAAGLLTADQLDRLLSAENLCALGWRQPG